MAIVFDTCSANSTPIKVYTNDSNVSVLNGNVSIPESATESEYNEITSAEYFLEELPTDLSLSDDHHSLQYEDLYSKTQQMVLSNDSLNGNKSNTDPAAVNTSREPSTDGDNKFAIDNSMVEINPAEHEVPNQVHRQHQYSDDNHVIPNRKTIASPETPSIVAKTNFDEDSNADKTPRSVVSTLADYANNSTANLDSNKTHVDSNYALPSSDALDNGFVSGPSSMENSNSSEANSYASNEITPTFSGNQPPSASNVSSSKFKREQAFPASENSNQLSTHNISQINQIQIPHDEKVRKPGQASLVLVFDATGSMEECLKQLRSGAKLIVEKFADSDVNPIFNYVFVPFRDPGKFFGKYMYLQIKLKYQ